ncbi:hypothetical protein HPB50_015436 [Hyalomma asiaticum]|uniref:Uncharacterized protein n=1 Tax=Hyalomma asiaticum TaxID=266040 RepID=A0ACB7TL61_HYAAI|nr:hypothetical protein HPB50_015436 [Hyalomma asiaticum]
MGIAITNSSTSTPDKACHRTFIDFHEADRGRPAAAPAAAVAAKTLLGRRRAPTNRCHRPGRLSLALRWTTRSTPARLSFSRSEALHMLLFTDTGPARRSRAAFIDACKAGRTSDWQRS